MSSAEQRAADVAAQGQVEACRCEELLERLYEYLDSEIPETDCARLRAHVEECGTCLEATTVETNLRQILRRSCAEVAPEELRVRVITQIEVLRRH